MLAYLRYLVVDYIHQDTNSKPSHDLLQLLTSPHVETFQKSFSGLNHTLDAIEEGNEEEELDVRIAQADLVSHDKIEADEDVAQSKAKPTENVCNSNAQSATTNTEEATNTTTGVVHHAPIIDKPCDSPNRSDEGYGSFSGASYTDHNHEQEHLETRDEIAALGIIEESEEVPDYGVALEPAPYNSISPEKPPKVRNTADSASSISPQVSPTKARLAELTAKTPRAKHVPSTKGGMSENARNLLTIGYTLSLMGEKINKKRSVEGSVKSVIVKAGQAIEKSQAGSVYGKSRYAGSRYGGSKYAGSRFGGSKRSVARSIVLEETLPAWGF